MGYTTDFSGEFRLDRPLDDETHALLVGLSTTRRMKRKGLDTKFGVDGEFYFNPESTELGQEREDSIVDFNRPPSTQPGLWCQWTPTEDKQGLVWDEGEKFYDYVEWMEYLIEKILKPRGYVVNGQVTWQGEDSDDKGMIDIRANVVHRREAIITYEGLDG